MVTMSRGLMTVLIFGGLAAVALGDTIVSVDPAPKLFTVEGSIQWDDGSPTDDPAVLQAATTSNLPVTIYRQNDLLGMVFPTLDLKILTSLTYPENTAVLNWMTNPDVNRQVLNCVMEDLSSSNKYPIPSALYAIMRVMITPSVPWKFSGNTLDVGGALKGYIFKKDYASGSITMVTSAKTRLATLVGLTKTGGGGSFSLQITKLLKRSQIDLTQFIDGKNVCEEYARDNFRNYSNVLVNVESVDGSFILLDGATYQLFQSSGRLAGLAVSNEKKRKYPNRIPFIRGPKPSNQTAYSVGGDDLSVLRVRNQGQCNSCYAFTAAAALEGSVWTQSDGAFSVYLSPQHLGDCENIISQSCNPGFGSFDLIFERIIGQPGKASEVPLSANIPFTALNGKCRKVQGFPTGLTKYMDISINNVTSIDDVKNSLVNYGSIAVGVASSYINDPTNIEAFNKGKDLPQAVNRCPSTNQTYPNPGVDHAVTIVGWAPCTLSRPEYGAELITTTCWKMLNSWGTGVGYAGYFYLPTNTSIDCGAFSVGMSRALLLDPSKLPKFVK